jgi:hypothetical protein
MKKYLSFLILGLYSASLFAAVASEQRIKADKVVVGRPSPATDPALEFQGTTQRIKANRTTGRMQFTNDGTNFKNIGSGSGGAGGVNLLTDDNGDFEAGDTAWTESGGTFSIETTNPLFGVGSGKWDSSASSQTLISNLKTIEKGMVGRTCLAEMVYKWPSGVAADLSFQVLDASDVVILTNDLTPTTGDNVVKTQRNFDCGVLGSQYRIRILSNVANPAEIIIDNAFIGSDSNSVSISQTTLAGSSDFLGTATCTQTRTSTTFGPFTGSAACPGPTIVTQKIGQWLTTDVDLPRQTINNLPPGTYVAQFTVASFMSSSATSGFAINDGTTTCNGMQGETSAASGASTTVSCVFEYSSSGNRSFELYGASSASTINLSSLTVTPNLSTKFNLYRYPTSPAEAITLETSGYFAEAEISGSSVSMGLTTDGSFSEVANSALTLVPKSGASLEIPCSTTNPSTGTTCAAGNESMGIVFNAPYAGTYDVCTQFTHQIRVDSGSDNITADMKLVETPNNAQTILQERASQRSRISWGVVGDYISVKTITMCGVFTFGSSGKKTIRLFEQTNAASSPSNNDVFIDANTMPTWSVKAITQQMPAPVFTSLQNNVKSGGDMRIEHVTFGGAVENTNVCSASPCTMYRNSSGITSVTRGGTGIYNLNFGAGVFSSAPTCSGYGSAPGVGPHYVRPSTAGSPTNILYTLTTGRTSTEAVADSGPVNIVCVGAR